MSEQEGERPGGQAGSRHPGGRAEPHAEMGAWAGRTEGGALAKGKTRGGGRAKSAADPCERRIPQRAHGRRRVDAILDAAAAIIAEEGLVALSMDAIVKRSGTSKSSMYHFFRDIGSVLHALAERHADNLCGSDYTEIDRDVAWERLTVEETVERFIEPFQSYPDEHPDFLLVLQATGEPTKARKSGVETMVVERAERIVAARSPGAKPADRRLRAVMMFAMVVGVMELSIRITRPTRQVLMREIKQVLVAYLATAEARDAAAD